VPLLTDAISALVARQPDLSVEIVEDTSAALLAQLDAGRLDLAICRTTITQAPQVYNSVKLQDETLAVIANVVGVASIAFVTARGGPSVQASHHQPMLLLLIIVLVGLSIPRCRHALENGHVRRRRRLIQAL